jgi:hypothetical protein
MDFAQVFYLSEAPSLPMTPYSTPPPLHTVQYTCIQYTYSHREGGRGVELTREKVRGAIVHKAKYQHDWLSELGTRSFFQGSLSAPYSIFSSGSLTLMRSFFEFPFSLVAQTLVAQPVVRWAKKG